METVQLFVVSGWLYSTRAWSHPPFQTLAPMVLGQLPRGGGDIDVTTGVATLATYATS